MRSAPAWAIPGAIGAALGIAEARPVAPGVRQVEDKHVIGMPDSQPVEDLLATLVMPCDRMWVRLSS